MDPRSLKRKSGGEDSELDRNSSDRDALGQKRNTDSDREDVPGQKRKTESDRDDLPSHKKPRYSRGVYYNKFDLLNGDNRYFRVTIDYYTPRPHFIILVKDEKKKSVSCVDLAYLETRHKEKFLQAACDLIKKYSLGKPILSIHRGSWVTTKNRLHFHVCTDADKYIEVFESTKDQIEPSSWPKPTRQWRLGNKLEDYEKNVRGYPFKSFKNEDIDDIKKLAKEDSVESSLKELKFEKYNLVFHETEPRLGFASPDKHTYLGVLNTMEQFAKEHGLTDTHARQNGELGGQLCLYLSKDPDTPGFPQDKGKVYGYMQLSGLTFYKMCPAEDRDQWLEKFEKSTVKNYT